MRVVTFPMETKMAIESEMKVSEPMMRQTRVGL